MGAASNPSLQLQPPPTSNSRELQSVVSPPRETADSTVRINISFHVNHRIIRSQVRAAFHVLVRLCSPCYKGQSRPIGLHYVGIHYIGPSTVSHHHQTGMAGLEQSTLVDLWEPVTKLANTLGVSPWRL